MDVEDFAPRWSSMGSSFLQIIPLLNAFPWISRVLTLVPEGILSKIFPVGSDFISFRALAREHITRAKCDKQIADEKGLQMLENKSVIRSIMNSNMPKAELSIKLLTEEAQGLFAAGSFTVNRSLDFLVYHILSLPDLRKRLAKELENPMMGYPEFLPPVTELEALPFLQATIKEGFQLGIGVMHRVPQCFPYTAVRYNEWVIPPDTPVGMSSYLNHTDPSIFKDPFDFNPDRWLSEVDTRMELALTPFGKGSRGCLGMNLAMTEVILMLAVLFRPGNPVMTLFETDETDVKPLHDFILAQPKLCSKGVRVTMLDN